MRRVTVTEFAGSRRSQRGLRILAPGTARLTLECGHVVVMPDNRIPLVMRCRVCEEAERDSGSSGTNISDTGSER